MDPATGLDGKRVLRSSLATGSVVVMCRFHKTVDE